MLIMSVAELKKRYKLGERNFEKLDLEGANLHSIELEEINLTGANLRGADLTDCNLKGACLNKVNFTNAKLIEADLDGASLIETNLTCANLIDASLNEAQLIGALLINGVLLQNAYLIGAFLNGAQLTEANLYKANFMGAHLNGACLKGAALQEAYLTGAYYNSKTEFDRNFDPAKAGMFKISDEVEEGKTTVAELLNLFNVACKCSCKYLGPHITKQYVEKTRPNFEWLEQFKVDRSGQIEFSGSLSEVANPEQLEILKKWLHDYRAYCARILPEFSNLI